MKLVIAEKPSVAMSLAAVLGATERKDGYLEGSGYLVSWCVGHLLELAQPEAYKEQYAKWRYEDLPILPENWKYEVPKDKKTQLALLCRLMKDKRVDSVVCATDAGREGELIFRLVYEYAGCKKPMERLWISSMEDAAIREGFDHLHPGSDYDKLYDAAVCRAGADWLIGINATRLFSVLYGVTLNVGRVMSPTLALLVQREGFKAKLYENLVSGILTKEEFLSYKRKYNADIELFQKAIVEWNDKLTDVLENRSERNRWINHFMKFSTMEDIDRRAVMQLIRSIRVMGKDELHIEFNYQDEYQKAISLAEQIATKNEERMVG